MKKIKCISNDSGGLPITINKEYKLEFIDKYGNYNVKNNDGKIQAFWHGRFKEI